MEDTTTSTSEEAEGVNECCARPFVLQSFKTDAH
jgi:hypothetical protein